MSRVGQAIINIPNGVEVKREKNKFFVKGSKGELSAPIVDIVDVTIKEKEIKVELKEKNNKNRAIWGTTRALINNAVKGVSVGFEKDMEIVGVGYRALLYNPLQQFPYLFRNQHLLLSLIHISEPTRPY